MIHRGYVGVTYIYIYIQVKNGVCNMVAMSRAV